MAPPPLRTAFRCPLGQHPRAPSGPPCPGLSGLSGPALCPTRPTPEPQWDPRGPAVLDSAPQPPDSHFSLSPPPPWERKPQTRSQPPLDPSLSLDRLPSPTTAPSVPPPTLAFPCTAMPPESPTLGTHSLQTPRLSCRSLQEVARTSPLKGMTIWVHVPNPPLPPAPQRAVTLSYPPPCAQCPALSPHGADQECGLLSRPLAQGPPPCAHEPGSPWPPLCPSAQVRC